MIGIKEHRDLKIMFNKSGGTASKGSYSPKISIPKSWLDDMNITIDEREVIAVYEDKKIIIQKKDK